MTPPAKLVLALTGGSGAIYAVRLLEVLVASGADVHLTISPAAAAVLQTELGIELDLHQPRLEPLTAAGEALGQNWRPPGLAAPDQRPGRVEYHYYQDFFAPIASGSHRTRGMVVCPASGGTISAIAHGASGNLIHRAADVHLKERRKLVLVPRETPLSLVQLDNLRRCAEAGAVVLPAMPGFYHGARSLADLVDFVVARICDQFQIDHQLVRRWGADG